MNQANSGAQPTNRQQSLENVQVQGDDNILNVIQAEVVTLTQTKIIQISVDAIKTRKLITTSPYKGLRPFEPEDTTRFFGRDRVLTGLLNELEQTNLVLLLGASGSGKSSIVRAGLIPWFSQQWGKHFVHFIFTPDQDPFESLYGSLLSRYKQAEARIARAGEIHTLSQVVQTLKSPESFWLLVIDQFEELFTISEPERRDNFIHSLVQLSQKYAHDRTVKIIATMRADFLDRLDPDPANLLVQATHQHRPMITQMQRDEVRLAIEQPAAQHGVVFEPGLVEAIINDVQGQAGYLPLLQYTLDLLWETELQTGGMQRRTLELSTYRQLGSVRGALQRRVDQLYGAFSEAEQLATQRIFLKLVEIGSHTERGTDWKPVRRRAARLEFVDSTEQAVLMQLIDQNLLVSDAIVPSISDRPSNFLEPTVEIAHEILLTSWTTLNTWIQENRQAIALRNRLNADVAIWQTEQADSDLWSGAKLEQVLELRQNPTFNQMLGGFSEAADQFIDASVGVKIRQRVEQLGFTSEALRSTQPVEAFVYAIVAVSLAQSTFAHLPNAPVLRFAQSHLLGLIQTNRERHRLLHDSRVSSIAFSPNGKTLVSGSSDRTVRLWDVATGQLIRPSLHGHEAAVTSVAFSPDGQTIVSGSVDQTVRLWDVATGQLIRPPLHGHEDVIRSVAISPVRVATPSGLSYLIVSGSSDKTVRLWELATGQPFGQPFQGHTAAVNAVDFSPNGAIIVSGSSDKTLRLWHAITGQPIGQPFQGHEALSVAFSPDGKTIASGDGDDTLRLWDVATGQAIGQPLHKHWASIRSVAFSPDGKTIASGSRDRRVRIWDVATGQLIGQSFQGHEDAVLSVAFSPDGKTLASSSSDRTVRLWDVTAEYPLYRHEAGVNAVTFNPDSQMIASGSSDKTLRLWDITTEQFIGSPLQGHEGEVLAVAFSPDSKTIVSGSSDKTLRLWDITAGQFIGQPFRGHQDKIRSVAFSPDGQTIVSGSYDKTLRLWDIITGQLIGQPFQGHEAEVMSVAFSPDGKTIVSGSADRTVRLWDAKTGQQIGQPFQAHQDLVRAVAFSPDGKTIVSGGSDDTLRLWDATTGQPIGQPFKGHEAGVRSVAFSPDGKMIVSSSRDRTVRLWDAATGEAIGQPFQGHEATVLAVAFSPDGRTVISGSNDSTVRRWSTHLEGLLQNACEQLQHHSILTHPPTDVAREAREVCQHYVWSKPEFPHQ